MYSLYSINWFLYQYTFYMLSPLGAEPWILNTRTAWTFSRSTKPANSRTTTTNSRTIATKQTTAVDKLETTLTAYKKTVLMNKQTQYTSSQTETRPQAGWILKMLLRHSAWNLYFYLSIRFPTSLWSRFREEFAAWTKRLPVAESIYISTKFSSKVPARSNSCS